MGPVIHTDHHTRGFGNGRRPYRRPFSPYTRRVHRSSLGVFSYAWALAHTISNLQFRGCHTSLSRLGPSRNSGILNHAREQTHAPPRATPRPASPSRIPACHGRLLEDFGRQTPRAWQARRTPSRGRADTQATRGLSCTSQQAACSLHPCPPPPSLLQAVLPSRSLASQGRAAEKPRPRLGRQRT